MRELAFRSWNGKEIEYFENYYFDLHLSDIIMQWTGLLDKNGKEIYEGGYN